MIARDACLALDAADPLAPLRQRFDLDDADARGLVYLDGNSLGAMPRGAAARMEQVVRHEWARGLVGSWNTAGWIDLADRVAARIAPLVGARAGDVAVTDSTSINLFKVLSAALDLTGEQATRRRILSERTNFPSDLYIAETLAWARNCELVLVDAGDIPSHLDERVAVLLLTHVNYRTGRLHPMRALTRAAHAAGALTVWDLAHSAGAVPVDLHGDDDAGAADFAIGCGYKYLNGGPGAPAFVWAHPRQVERLDRAGWRSPLSGWLGHAQPFAFAPEYRPAPGMRRFVCGTPPILSLAALDAALQVFDDARERGGMVALRRKSLALTSLFIDLVESHGADHGVTLVTPRDAESRGSQVSFACEGDGYAVMQALIARGVVGDFREPDILRFGFTPLYTRFADVWDAATRLAAVLSSGEWRDPRYRTRAPVT